jgi:hypothetical protein
MFRHRVVHTVVALLTFTFVSGWFLTTSANGADEGKPETKAKKERAEMRGPLPLYYRSVVDGIQKEQMYKICDTYEPKLDELRKQMKALEDKRDAEMEALLRPDQKEKVKQLSEEAKQKRAKKDNAATKSDAGAVATKP